MVARVVLGLMVAALVVGCNPKQTDLDISLLKGRKPLAIVKGPNAQMEWYFYYQLDDDYAATLKRADEDLDRRKGWNRGEADGLTKYRQAVGAKWYQVTVAQGTWELRSDGFYQSDGSTKGTGILVIEGRPGF